MESVDPQNENTAAENAAQAPEVATGGAAASPTPDVASTEAPAQTEQQTETATTEQATTTEAQPDPSQLAADGDAVVDGLEENHTNPVAPNEGQ